MTPKTALSYLAALSALVGSAGSLYAQSGFGASIVSASAVWPSSAAVHTGTPGDSFNLSDGGSAVIAYDNERDVKNQRTLSQSFMVTQTLEVTDLYFGYSGGTGITDSVQIRIFEVDDVHGLANGPGDAVDDIITFFPVTGPGTLNTVEIFNQAVDLTANTTSAGDFDVMHLSVSGITLPARTGSSGYLISLFNPDSDGVLPFKWAIERGDSEINSAYAGPYLGGRAFGDNDGSHEENTDWAFALDGVVVPEPSSTSLFVALAAVASLARRRRK